MEKIFEEKILKNQISNNLLEEIKDNSSVVGAGWLQLSPVSKALGNKGSICTGTIECQNNCR